MPVKIPESISVIRVPGLLLFRSGIIEKCNICVPPFVDGILDGQAKRLLPSLFPQRRQVHIFGSKIIIDLTAYSAGMMYNKKILDI